MKPSKLYIQYIASILSPFFINKEIINLKLESYSIGNCWEIRFNRILNEGGAWVRESKLLAGCCPRKVRQSKIRCGLRVEYVYVTMA